MLSKRNTGTMCESRETAFWGVILEKKKGYFLITGIISFFLYLICLSRPLISGITFPKWNYLYQTWVLVMVMAWLIMSWEKGRLKLLKTNITLPLILLSFFILLSVSQSVNLYRSFKFLWQFSSYVLLFYVVINNIKSSRQVNILISCMLSAGLLVSLYGFFQYFWGLEMTREFVAQHPDVVPSSPHFQTRLMSNWIFSTFVYQNALAGYLLINIPLALSFLIITRNYFLKAGFLLTLLCMITALFMSYSKAGWCICVFLLFLYGLMFIFLKNSQWRSEHNRKIRIVFLILLLGVTALVAVNPSGRLGLDTFSGSMVTRLRYWQAAIGMIRERPFLGFGPDCFGSVYARFKPVLAEETQMAHNNYIQMWTDSGIFAFLSFLWLWAAFYKNGLIKLFKRETDPDAKIEERDRIILLGLLTGIIGFLLHGLVDFSLHVAGIATQVFVMMGLVFIITRKKYIVLKISSTWRMVLVVITAGLTLFTCYNLGSLVRSEIYSDFAQSFMKEKKHEKAERFIRKSLKDNEHRSELYYYLAKIDEAKLDNKIKANKRVTLKEINKVLDLCRETIRRNPNMAHYHYQLSLYYWKYRRLVPLNTEDFTARSLAEIKKAIELYPTKCFYRRQLARLYNLLNQPDKAQEQIKQAEYLKKLTI